MNRILIAIGLSVSLAGLPALAQTTPEVVDADGNGVWSMEELQVTYPDLTEEVFAAVDTNADGQVDQAEYDAAVEAKLLAQ